MFGYIKPYQPEMKLKELEAFKAVYCGLCRQLKKAYGPFATLTLSYDFTFLAVVSMGIANECAGFKKCRCSVNPFLKKPCAVAGDDLSFAASVAMLMLYYKAKDNIADSGFWGKLKAYLLLPFAAHAKKKAAKRYPEIDRMLLDTMRRQSALESDGTGVSVDRAADPTATALGGIFGLLSADPSQREILTRFGYLLGRYVYFADALDDLEEDQKKGQYNPFLYKFQGEEKSLGGIKEYAKEVLYQTVGEIPPAFELIKLNRHKEILENMIYLGLHSEIRNILNKSNRTDPI